MTRATRPKARDLIAETWQSQANLSLFLILLVITVFVLPTLEIRRTHIGLYGNLVFPLVLLTGTAIAWGRRWLFTLAVSFAIPALIARWIAWVVPTPSGHAVSEFLSLLSVLTIVFVVLAQVFRDGPINAVRVQGAVAAYLLLGVAYAYGYQIDVHFNPVAVGGTQGNATSMFDWIYFSFCTLSTVGYGDIVPASRFSRSLAIGEAITGQLYLAILIARLVALQVSNRTSERSHEH